MADSSKLDWKELAEMAAREPDPTKLLKIVTQLNSALLERERASKGPRPRVLVVDDEPNVAHTLVPVLQKNGYETQFADTISTAVSAVENGAFDALICDLNIAQPGDGFAVVTAMRELRPRSVIMLLTGYPGFDSAIAAIRKAVDDYFVKPVDYDQLLERLQNQIAEKQRQRP